MLPMSLQEYNEKRDFRKTSEPKGEEKKHRGALRFVVQRHLASKLHYDFRLEMESVLKSWAVPKGPSLNPADKRLAVEVEDHPYAYRTFEGDIPEGSYGAGHVDIWDEGTYHASGTEDPRESEQQLLQALEEGRLSFVLHGRKLKGEFSLVKMQGRQENAWLLMKKQDGEATDEAYDAEAHLERVTGTGSLQAAPETGGKKKKAGKAKKGAEAKAGPMPHGLEPMKARLTDAPFDGDDWLFEIKWDGFRAIAEVDKGKALLYSRKGNSFNDRYPTIVKALEKLGRQAVLDGEVVVLDEKGRSQFQQLQNYQNTPTESLFYCVFDLLYLDGEDLRPLPLLERKERLRDVIKDIPELRYSEHVQGRGVAFFKQAQKNRIEGIMAKEAHSPYRAGKRSTEWLKIKTHLRQEAVICGFTEPKGSRILIGALVLGVYEEGKLVYAGQCGSGFNRASLKLLHDKLMPLAQEDSPFAGHVKPNAPVTWVKPQLLAEVSFAEWTKDGQMRQAIFEGLREDKNPKEVVREEMLSTRKAVAEGEKAAEKPPRKTSPKAAGASGKAKDGSRKSKGEDVKVGRHTVTLTSLDKLYWPEEGITKGDLISYYRSISKIILPYLKDRPESLLRHPNGITRPGFFQKDVTQSVPEWVETERIKAESTGEDVNYIICNDEATLTYLNNLGCIQLNPWNSRLDSINSPDYMVIDLDPGENTYDEVIQTALVTKQILDEAGAACYCKTSGATGMHIFVPMGAKYPFEQVKEFAHLVAKRIHAQLPKLTSLERSPKERRRQIYLDFLQNAIGQTIAAPYCVRPRPGATVSAPLKWEEVKPGLHPSKFTMQNMPARIEKEGDLFKPVLGKAVDLEKCLQQLKAKR